jgi:hypothetical protein
MKPQLLIDVVETLTSCVDELDIEGAIEEVVNTFLRHGMTLDDLRECYGVSDELDEIIDGYESTQEDEEEEWLDGGREDF